MGPIRGIHRSQIAWLKMNFAPEKRTPRPRQLYVLMVEDAREDVELLERHFITSGYLATIDSVASPDAMREALANEILEAYQGQGNAIRKRDEVHKMAQANKAFAHFRW